MDIQTELSPTVTFTTNHRSSKQTRLLLWYLQHIFWRLGGLSNYEGEFGESCCDFVCVSSSEGGWFCFIML